MSLSRDGFLAKQDDVPTDYVKVPEFGDGETVRVRGLTSQARFDWMIASNKAADGEESSPEPTAYMVVLGAIDENGARLFQITDVDAVANMRGDVIDRVATRIMELSGMTQADSEAASGNSDATPSGDSGSVSPETSAAPSLSSVTG